MRGTKEMSEIFDAFEKAVNTDYAGYVRGEVKRIDPHGRPVAGYPKDYFYSNGEVNQLFKFFLLGYTNAKSVYSQPTTN